MWWMTIVHAERLHPARVGDAVVGGEVVAHHLDAEVASGIDDAADRRLVRAAHHDDERRAGLGHHLGLEVPAVHRLQVGDDRMVREARAQRLDRAQPLRQDQRRAGLEPVDAGIDGDRGGLERLVERRSGRARSGRWGWSGKNGMSRVTGVRWIRIVRRAGARETGLTILATALSECGPDRPALPLRRHGHDLGQHARLGADEVDHRTDDERRHRAPRASRS